MQVRERIWPPCAPILKDKKLRHSGPMITQHQALENLARMQKAIAHDRLSMRTMHAAQTIRYITITDPDAVITDPDALAAFGYPDVRLTGCSLMRRMYPLYKRTFPIAEERSSLKGLIKAMRMNMREAVQRSNQRTQESWVLAYDTSAKRVVAGYNSLTISTANTSEDIRREADAGSVLIYIFVDAAYRDSQITRVMADMSEAAARDFAARTHNDGRTADKMVMIETAEQNDPRAMTPCMFIEDSTGAGIDQCVRRAIFQKNYGFGQIDFPYMQPSLEGQESCEGLTMIVRRRLPPGSSMSPVLHSMNAKMLKMIIENFIEKSFFEGDAYKNDAAWQKMARHLDAMIAANTRIPVLQDIDFLSIKADIHAKLESIVKADDFDAHAYFNLSFAMLGIAPAARVALPSRPVHRPALRPAADISARTARDTGGLRRHAERMVDDARDTATA